MEAWRAERAGWRARLSAAGVAAPEQELWWILEAASGLARSVLQVAVADELTDATRRRAADLVDRRSAGEPLAYVLGSWSFRGLDLMVDRRVLIPRPETEVVAGVAVVEAVRAGARSAPSEPWAAAATTFAAADLGTGSGAIALALAAALPDAEVWATDSDEDALAVARANVAGHGSLGARVRLARGDWFGALPSTLRRGLRVVVANPPYISRGEAATLPREVAEWEPAAALVSGPTGFEAIDALVRDAPGWIEPGGALVCEVAPHQAERACRAAVRAGFGEVAVEQDLAGRDRVLVARGPG